MNSVSRLKTFFDNHKIIPDQENARSFVFDCPACGGHRKLYIQKKDGRSVCFKQGSTECPKPGGQAPYALSLIAKIPIWQAKEEYLSSTSYGEDLNVNLDIDDIGESVKKSIEPIDKKQYPRNALPINNPMCTDGQNYLSGRGLDLETLSKYNVLYSLSDRRVIFTVNMNDKMYGWQGRAVDPVDKKYRMKNLPGEWKSKSLMFYDNILKSDHVIIAEGPISALKFEKVGGFVATMGKTISKSQLELIIDRKNITKVYLALDRDAFDLLRNIVEYFINNTERKIEVYEIEIPSHRDDFGDCTYDECELAFKQAKPLTLDNIFVDFEANYEDI